MKITRHSSGLQALRGLACLAVVAYHAAGWPNGAAGVDVFFVVSGFVMVVAASRLEGRAQAGQMFLAARLRRIVPLYWLCTGVKMAALWAAGIRLGWYFCLASLLFLPVHDAAGLFKPIIPVGWTLTFEMLFYLLFAISLGARRAPALYVPPVLLVLAVLPHGTGAWGELCNPVILEFAFGVGVALLWQRGRMCPPGLAWPLLLGSIACLLFVPRTLLGGRFLSWGLPACGLVAAILSLERPRATALPRWLLALGDASYAIYLTHGFVLMAVRTCFPGASGLAAWLCGIPAAAGFGWLVHRFVERRWLGDEPNPAPLVLVLVGGGLAPVSGGVGVLLRNLERAWAHMPEAPRTRMIDTRGGGGMVAGMMRFCAAAWLVALLCATRRAQLVHAHMTTRGSAFRKTLLCATAMSLRVPVVIHMHGADFMPFYRALPGLLRAPLAAVLRRAAHVVVLGAAWRRFLITELGVRAERISILPNGVPAPAPTLHGAQKDAPLILFLGRLCARKGVPELVAALGAPALRTRAWRAVIAGDGDPAPFRAMLGWYRLSARVQMPGWVGRSQASELLAQADILVLPSYHEAMPIAVLEALAAHVAVITTPVGAIPEFLQHGVSALLVAPGDIAGLAGALQALIDDPDLRARLAAAGHAVFREKLEIGGVAAQLAGLYRSAIAAPEWQAAEAAE